MASHDLRNPLATLRGFLELLIDSEPLTEHGRHLADRAVQVTVRMNELIDAIGTYGRARRSPLEPMVLATRLAVDEALDRLAQVHPGAHEHVRLEADLPRVHADAEALTDAVAAVLDNALRYTVEEAAPSVVVRGGLDGDRATIVVEDEGPGLPPGSEAAIFEPFTKTINSRGHRTYGLGLALARVLVERMGGAVTAASRDDRTGTRVTIELPARP